MGSTEPIIKWLKSEGVTNSEQAKEKLLPLVRNNMMSCASHVGRGHRVSLAGTSNGVDKIIKYFDEHQPVKKKVVKKVSSIKPTEEFKPKKKITTKVKSLDGKSLESLEVTKKKKVIKKKTV